MQGHCLRDGICGKTKDPAAALVKYRAAANMGSAEGMFSVGQMLTRGPDALLNFEEGRRWLERAAAEPAMLSFPGGTQHKNLGVMHAKLSLGHLYRDGLGLPKNVPKVRGDLIKEWWASSCMKVCKAWGGVEGLCLSLCL